MNFSRFQNRGQVANPQGRNLGHDLHEFMDGLSKIAQIMYTSIPIIEFIKIASKYSWKFCEYLGTHVLALAGIITVHKKPEVILEAVWNSQPIWKSMARYSFALAVIVILFCLLSTKPDLEEEWKNTPETQQRQNPLPELRSVEDKPYEEDQYDEYNSYPMY